MKHFVQALALLILGAVVSACGGRGPSSSQTAPEQAAPSQTAKNQSASWAAQMNAQNRALSRRTRLISYESLTPAEQLLLEVIAERRALSNLRFRARRISPERFEARVEEYEVSWSSDGAWCVNVAAQGALNAHALALALQPCDTPDMLDATFGPRTILITLSPTFLQNPERQGEGLDVLRAHSQIKMDALRAGAEPKRIRSPFARRVELTQISVEMRADQLFEVELAREYAPRGDTLEKTIYILHRMRPGFQITAAYKDETDLIESEQAFQTNIGALDRFVLRRISDL